MKFSFRKAMGIMMSALAISCFTACESDSEEGDGIEEILGGKYDLSELTAIANTDGTITIEGVVKSATKLKDLKLKSKTQDKEYDLKSESPVQTKEGDWKWITNVRVASIPVDIYTFTIDSRFTTTKETVIGAAYEFIAGNSKSEQGSFLSFSQKCNYTVDAAKQEENAKNIEAVLNDDLTIIPASQMKNTTIKPMAGDSKVYENCVITSNECIATYKVEKIEGAENDLKISGIRIMSSEILKIDVSAQGFSK